MLLCFIFHGMNFLGIQPDYPQSSDLSVFIASFKTSEGLFWAKMSAAATITALPVVVAGWVAQRQLVRGLTAGAVK
jgi:sorbitol/mannitol transport system permease protein